MEDDQLSEVRSRYIGFIFQSYNLLQQYTVVENIEIPLLYQGTRLDEHTRERCIDLAELVGLGSRLDHRPTQLSGGQQQRVAIARALVNDPHIILADEPTGNLDSHTSDEIMRLLRKLNQAGKTIIMVTHENDIAAWARRVVRMRDGAIESDVRNDAEPDGATAPSPRPATHRPPPTRSRTPAAPRRSRRPRRRPRARGGPRHAPRRAVAKSEPPPPPRPTSLLGAVLAAVALTWVKGRSGFVLALRSLWLHKLRAVLSVLGIIIGTAAVIALMAFGKGSMEDALEDIRRQGTTNVIVRSVKPVDEASNAAPVLGRQATA